jgi:hypothetical protein
MLRVVVPGAILLSVLSPAYAAAPELLVPRVSEELLKDGISLERLGLALKMHRLEDGLLVDLVDEASGKSVLLRKLPPPPESTEVAVAELTVVVSEMVKEARPVPAAPPKIETPHPDEKVLRVRIDADDPNVELHRRSVTGVIVGEVNGVVQQFEKVCEAPCNRSVDLSVESDYFIAGSGVSASRLIDLSRYRDEVTIKVEAGSSGQRLGGIIGMVVGFAAAHVGGVLLAVARADDLSRAEEPAGITMIAAGLGVGVLGLALFLSSGTTFEITGGGAAL